MWGWLHIDNLGPRVRNCVSGTRSCQCTAQVLCSSSRFYWISFQTAPYFSLNWIVSDCVCILESGASKRSSYWTWAAASFTVGALFSVHGSLISESRGRWSKCWKELKEPQRCQVKTAHNTHRHTHLPELGVPVRILFDFSRVGVRGQQRAFHLLSMNRKWTKYVMSG